jgi:hypothetical protein
VAVPLAVIVLASVACGNDESATATAEIRNRDLTPTVQPDQYEVVETPGSGDTLFTPRISDGSAPLPEILDLPDLDESLESLEGFTIEMDAQFLGEDESGTPVEWSITSRRRVSTAPSAEVLELTIDGFDDLSEFDVMSLVTIGQDRYLAFPGVGCLARAIESEDSSALANLPDELVAGLSGARSMAEIETVNGIVSQRYYFDEEARAEWRDQGLLVDGHLFIAKDGGYVTRIEVTVSGSGQFHDQRDSEVGTLTILIDVFDADGQTTIGLPEACAVPADYPVVDDAFQITAIGDLVSFRTNMAPVELLAFYEEEMLNAGWSLVEEAILLDDSAFLIYQKPAKIVTISLEIESPDGPITVLISP